MLLRFVSLVLPWNVRRTFLQKQFGYEIHPSSRIGLSWIFPKRLILEAETSVGDLTVCKGLDLLHVKAHSSIGRGNWITGFPSGASRHFAAEPDRRPQLIIGEHSAITHRHLIDCTNSITIGNFTTVAGFQSQLLTHTIDLALNRQSSQPIRIGDYCFVGTNCVLLGGSSLPDYSVLGAKSLLNKRYNETHRLYAGVPARPVQELPAELEYFRRTTGFVY